MKTRKLLLAVFLGTLCVTLLAALIPSPVQGQTCGLPGLPDCPPREKKTKIPTRVPPTGTPTATPTLVFAPQSGGEGGTLIPISTVTTAVPPWYATWVTCQGDLEATMIATLGHDDLCGGPCTPDWHATAVAPCDKYKATATPFFIPPVAGPVFLAPGVKNVLILVLIIGVLLTGGVLIARLGKK